MTKRYELIDNLGRAVGYVDLDPDDIDPRHQWHEYGCSEPGNIFRILGLARIGKAVKPNKYQAVFEI